jgi:hypothetical protein
VRSWCICNASSYSRACKYSARVLDDVEPNFSETLELCVFH